MTRKITQGDRRSLRRIIRKHIVRSDHDFGMLRTEYIKRVEVDDMAADLVEWADRRALRTASAPAPSVVPESGVTIDPRDGRMVIATLEGGHWVNLGDWIIRGVQGEFYPCKSDIFEATYERVDDDERTDSVSEVRGDEAP